MRKMEKLFTVCFGGFSVNEMKDYLQYAGNRDYFSDFYVQ